MAAEVRLLHEPQEDTVGMSLRTATQTVDMSLRTVDKTPETEQPGDSAGMSLRTATQTVDMLLRTADTPSKNQQPGHQHAGMSLRTVDTQSENQKPGHQHAGMSLRTAKESVDMSLRTVGLRIKSRGPAFWYVVADCQTKRGSSLSARSGACGSSLDKPTSRNGGEISR